MSLTIKDDEFHLTMAGGSLSVIERKTHGSTVSVATVTRANRSAKIRATS